MRANPGFTAVAVASLALGIGVNTAMFSAVDQTLIRRLPVPEPQQLVSLKGSRIQTYPFYREFRDRNQVFSGLLAAGYGNKTGVRPEGAREIELAEVNLVSGTYFRTLGVGAARGRLITPQDDQKPGGSPVAVLSYSYWERRFSTDPNVVGRKIAVNGYPLEIVGIAQKGFGGLFLSDTIDLFAPLTMIPVIDRGRAEVWDSPNMHWLWVMGRLKPGISMEQAQASLRVLQPQVEDVLATRLTKDNGKRPDWKSDPIVLAEGAQGLPFYREQMADPLRILSFATGFVLLIAGANVANLLLARAAGRQKEMAVRIAIGATRARLIRQLLTESLLLSFTGGIAGVALSYWGVRALASVAGWEEMSLRPDLHLFLFAAAAIAITGLLFGLAPAIRSARSGLTAAMKVGARFRLGKTLIAAQVALSLALLVAAGLFLQTLRNIRSVDPGFRRKNVLIVDVDPSTLGYGGQRLRAFYDQVVERVRALPGVRAASLSGMTPFGNYSRSRSFSAEGVQPKAGEMLMSFSNPVSSDYFATMGIPMLLGRDFRASDEPSVLPQANFLSKVGRNSGGSSEPPKTAFRSVIVNQSLARKLFGGANPVGKRISYDDRYAAEGSFEIVGVVRDVHYVDLKRGDDLGMIYEPSWGEGADARWIGIRTAGDPKALASAVGAELRKVDPDVPILRTRTMEEYVGSQTSRERMMAVLCTFFGAIALLLAAVGLYGVMAHAVTQRTKEVGIRMALGARQSDVVRMVVRESMIPVAAGIVVGLAAALGLTRFLASMLFGVAPRDPLSIAVAAAALIAVAALAAAIPARRASRVEPTIALRYE